MFISIFALFVHEYNFKPLRGFVIIYLTLRCMELHYSPLIVSQTTSKISKEKSNSRKWQVKITLFFFFIYKDRFEKITISECHHQQLLRRCDSCTGGLQFQSHTSRSYNLEFHQGCDITKYSKEITQIYNYLQVYKLFHLILGIYVPTTTTYMNSLFDCLLCLRRMCTKAPIHIYTIGRQVLRK